MMKYFILIGSSLLLTISAYLLADNQSRPGYGGSPTTILDTVVDKANEDFQVQGTKLDDITSNDTSYTANPDHRLTNTLVYFKDNIHPYIQRTVYIGLAIATILLIYNGFLLVTNGVHGEGEFSKIKGNLIAIGIWVIILTGFYFLIDLVVAVINAIFG